MGQWTSSKFPFVTLSLKKSCLYTQILAQHTKPFSSMLSTATRAFLFLSATSTLPRYTATTTKTRLRGVVFDMYRAVLGDDEYRRIKAQSPSGIDNLSHIDRWLQHQQQQAYDTIADFKRQALLHLQIMPGAADLCRLRGLITRNVKSAVDIFHERFGITFSPALSREFRPYKPDPAPQLHICSLWEVQPNEVIMIGDSLKDDGGDPNLAEVNTVPQPGTTDEAASKADDDGSSVVYVHSDATYCKKLNKGCAAGIIRDSRGNFLFGFYIKLGENEFIHGVEAQKQRRLPHAKPNCNAWSGGKKKRKEIHVLV